MDCTSFDIESSAVSSLSSFPFSTTSLNMSSDMPSDAYAIWAKHNKCAHSGEPRLYPVLESIVLDTFKHIRKPQDLTWLWVGGRHVSKHFRCEIERIFRTVFVPETILYCNMGKSLHCSPLSAGSVCYDRRR